MESAFPRAARRPLALEGSQCFFELALLDVDRLQALFDEEADPVSRVHLAHPFLK